MTRYTAVILALAFGMTSQLAEGFEQSLDYTQVQMVVARETAPGVWRFEVTLRHDDTGWDHYADEWQVLDPATGEVLGRRVLAHPHVDEQPFTRSQSGIEIPEDTTSVLVRAKCNVHGFGGREVEVDLTRQSGERFEVRRR
jgi:hypothetical protein